MRLALAEQEVIGPWHARTIVSADAPPVGELMLAAYRGTADDEGETEADAIAEVERTLGGEFGRLLPDCSFVVEDHGRVVAASMITQLGSYPVLTYVVVHPAWKRRGIGTFLIAAGGNALLSAGHSTLDLFVTEANEPAVLLYRKLGFEVIDRITGPS
jgi:ribosomal protein S18 acetylase RimI-like enzyme